jgi:LAS superfamily LD-carboxypeptidase LdcB
VAHRASLAPPARRTSGLVLAGLALLGLAIAAFVVRLSPVASAPSSSSTGVMQPTGAPTVPGEADGVIADGVAVSVFDDAVPAVSRLDAELLGAVRRAASDAATDGVAFRVNSGWRSAAYQRQLLEEAVAEYGSEEEAARWVATPATSAHVSGDAVDIGPFAAAAWLAEHGGAYGLCRTYGNESWHFELRPAAVEAGCPPVYADPTEDPRMYR